MRHTRYRQLDTLIIGANPEKLNAPPRAEVKVDVDWPGHGRWQASTAQVKGLLFKASMVGGSIQAQRKNGDWERIYNYKTVRGVRYGCALSTGEWFEVIALREVA